MAGLPGHAAAVDQVELFEGQTDMRLTRKFIVALVIGVAIVALIQAFFDYRREREVFDKQMRAEATALGRALARGMAEVWARDGEAAARQFLGTASSKSELIRARWVWLDATTSDKPHAPREVLAPMAQGQVVTSARRSRSATIRRARSARAASRSRKTSATSIGSPPIRCAARSSVRRAR